jgi:hypothetical protein
MRFKLLFLGLVLVGIVACENDEEEPVSCTMTEVNVTDVGAPVGADFNVIDVNMSSTISASTCSGVPMGTTGPYLMDAQRVGNTLTLTDTDSNSLVMAISGTDISPISDSTIIGSCQIRVTFSGSLDTGTDEITVTGEYTVLEISTGGCLGIL